MKSSVKSKHIPRAILYALIIVTLFAVDPSVSWRRRRRRRCTTNNWGGWSRCSVTCGAGTQKRKRTTNCGGTATEGNRQCSPFVFCPVDCQVNAWKNVGSCTKTCGGGAILQTRTTKQKPFFGGKACPVLHQLANCAVSPCPVRCVYNLWAAWSTCPGCGGGTQQTRTRTVTLATLGSSCTSTSQSRNDYCRKSCCAQNCIMSSWTNYGSCSVSCGYGIKWRYRSVVRKAACGGTACPKLLSWHTSCRAKPKLDCKVNSWGGWTVKPCKPCLAGDQYRYRSVVSHPQCGGTPCPVLTDSRSAICPTCCPKSCTWSAFNSWSTCSSTCGTGRRYRYRSLLSKASCGGSCTGSSQDIQGCKQFKNQDCKVSDWTLFTPCTSVCGLGKKTRTRAVIVQQACNGRACPPTSDTQPCTVYQDRDCKVSLWGKWTACSSPCAVGLQFRYRKVTLAEQCRGQCKDALSESRPCGTANGGCDQVCKSGVCSCSSGYVLSSDRKTCVARSCGSPKMSSYCAPGMQCIKCTPKCTGTFYGSSCTLLCPSGYTVKGGSATILCQATGVWTDHSTTHCQRNNMRPTQVNTFPDSLVPDCCACASHCHLA
eukprot:scpid43133/ scgid1842/ Spondin-1; F-spondin